MLAGGAGGASARPQGPAQGAIQTSSRGGLTSGPKKLAKAGQRPALLCTGAPRQPLSECEHGSECELRGGRVRTALVPFCQVGKWETLKFSSPAFPPVMEWEQMESRVSLLTTQDLLLCRRVSEIRSQTTEPQEAQSLLSCSEGQGQEAGWCPPWLRTGTREVRGPWFNWSAEEGAG